LIVEGKTFLFNLIGDYVTKEKESFFFFNLMMTVIAKALNVRERHNICSAFRDCSLLWKNMYEEEGKN
jgi:hypothetical protein